MSILSTAAIQQDLAAVGAALRRVTVVVRAGARHASGRRARAPGGGGSGIVVGADGTIVTNAHVATDRHLVVELHDGRSADARLVARDPGRDLALLRIDASALDEPLAVATVGDSTTLRPGQLVVAIGHPLGVAHALALGVVHTIGRATWQGAAEGAPTMIHTDIRLAPGNSGGPLADVQGRVVGVNTMIAGGLGVAVSIDEVRRLLAADGRRAA
jgi:serine protease Do